MTTATLKKSKKRQLPKTVKNQIDEIFKSHVHQSEAIMEIYKLVIPDLDDVKKVHGWPEISTTLWKYICNGFIKFDQQHHPNVLAGGIWLNNGFAHSDHLNGLDIDLENCRLEY